MSVEDTINEQRRKTEQVMSQVTGKPVTEASPGAERPGGEGAKVVSAPVPTEDEATRHLANLVKALTALVREEVLAELIPLMEAMERSSRPVAHPPESGVLQPRAPVPSADVGSHEALWSRRAQELQDLIEQKLERRRRRFAQLSR